MYRVLALTEDTKQFAQLEDNIKQHDDIEILTCTDNLDLLEKFLSQHTELVVLDIDLLNKEVIKLIKILRSLIKGLKIVLILSEEKMSICPDVLSLGIFSYLIKPISLKNAGEIISSALQIQTVDYSLKRVQ